VSKGSGGDFFVRKKAPAVLKHELLRQYVEPFTGMVGSTSTGARVVFLDGYAGQGRYDDGSAGSPELAMKAAEALLPSRVLECVFVERDRQPYASLEAVAAEYAARGVRCRALRGKVEDHLDGVVAQAADAPLFMFLDPCGLSLPLDTLVGVLVGTRSAPRPQTETLLNFSNEAVRRIGGHLRSPSPDEVTLRRMDVACGGDWWRRAFLDAESTEWGVEAVVSGFARRFREQTGYRVVLVPVRQKVGLLPLYHLVFATRSNYGLWVFADALAKAEREWRRAQLEDEPADPAEAGVLFGLGELLQEREERLEAEGVAAIERNLSALLETHRRFQVLDHVDEVFGEWYGIARETWVRAAVKNLYKAGVTSSTGTGKRIRELIVTRG
jgi:three-Cys-motif partner protein